MTALASLLGVAALVGILALTLVGLSVTIEDD